MNNFKAIPVSEFKENPILALEKDWMLITAGTTDDFNMMTAAWGGFGFLWKKPVSYIFIRPQRHTFKYAESNNFFTLTFFSENYRSILNKCGTLSGRDFDKMGKSGLKPFATNHSVAFEEARIIIECKKIYQDDIKEQNFIDTALLVNYPLKDYHRMYIGEILNIFLNEKEL